MARKKDADPSARRRPSRPFEIRLVDGRRFRFRSVDEFAVGDTGFATLPPENDVLIVSLALISTIRPLARSLKGRRRWSG